jgi:hypothetical protein
MNLLLSNKIRLINKHHFFMETSDQPCWYAEFLKSDKPKQNKWKLGVSYLGQKEEHLVSLASLDLENKEEWNRITSKAFALELIDIYRLRGIKSVKEWLKDTD